MCSSEEELGKHVVVYGNLESILGVEPDFEEGNNDLLEYRIKSLDIV